MADDRGRGAGDPAHGAASLLLRAKVRVPAAPEHYVRRRRLLDLLEETVSTSLTLVVAPAGAGKTVLLAGWITESSVPAAWLSLDEADGDGAQFWSGVIAALDTLVPGSGAEALGLLQRAGPLTDVVGRLLNDLEVHTGPAAVLVIDDVHLVAGRDDVAVSLGRFVRHLPDWLHVVLAARRDPDLPIDRLRARGGLGEVRFAELKFSRDEAHELLSRLSPALAAAEVDVTVDWVEGWAAGLQMAALAARSTHARPPADALRVESDLLIDDYVWHEVLGAEDPELVEVLLGTAVVDRVNNSLAQALTGRSDAADQLRRAEARGLFVTRIGVDGWFTVHSLVRAALLAELTRRSPSELTGQHARAARWLQDAGEVPAALEHWLLAERPRDALRLLAAKHPELYDTGREAVTLRTIAAIPATVATGDLGSLLEYAWCHILVNRRRFTDLVRQAAWQADHAEADQCLRPRLAMLQSMAATMGGEWVRGGSLARGAIGDLGDEWWRDPLGPFGWIMIAREIALTERWDDDEARDCTLALGRDPERSISLEGTRALGEALAGRPLDALRVAAGVRHAAAVTNMTILRAELALAEALAHRELGDRARARSELHALAEGPAETMLYCRIIAAFELAQADLDDGDVDAALMTFARAEALVETEAFGADGRQWLARLGTTVALAAGHVDLARRRADQVDDPFWSGISRARVHLAAGDRAGAAGELDTAVPRSVRHEVVLGLLRARTVTDRDLALTWATAAAELAAGNGLLQSVASEGPEAVELVEHAAWRVPPEWVDRLRRAATDQRCRGGRHDIAGLDSLTERERDVLRFLPSRLTTREIADELFVSSNTLKFHLKVIYRKLGVSSRAEAAQAARVMASVRR